LRLPQKQKFIVIITFSFGIFTAVVGVIRVAYLQSAATSNAIEQTDGLGNGGNSKPHQDFSCKLLLSPSTHYLTKNNRVRRIHVHVVCHRNQCRYHLCMRTESEAVGCTSTPKDDQGLHGIIQHTAWKCSQTKLPSRRDRSIGSSSNSESTGQSYGP
jgi:hypothetical protein